MNGSSARTQWASRLGFILAAAGSAIGLGNIWKFPYITGQNGGGAFVLVYLLCILLVGLPIMMAELHIGRHGQRDAVGCFAVLEGKPTRWRFIGWLGVSSSFLLLSFYAVVAGWSFDYVVQAASGAFQARSAEEINAVFAQLVSSPGQVVFWQGSFLVATAGIVLGGVRGGIERWSKILMPLLFLLLLLLFFRGMLSPGAKAGLEFMFRPDFSKLTPAALLDALGHAFFTLSLGAGTMITYGSYLDRQADLLSLSVRITLLDIMVALLAGLAIFPVVFAAGLEPGSGPGLVFQTIPIVFSAMPFGSVLAVLFFLLLSFAAMSSSISMLEVSVSYLVDEKGWRRGLATMVLGLAAFVIGLPSALSFNLLADVTPFFGQTFFDFANALVSSYLLPLGGFSVAVYAGWFWKGERLQDELSGGKIRPWLYPLWHFLVKYVAPAAVAVVLLNQMGWFTP
ncbi:sodium-dependent transporter [Desulfuromonas sp. AOP6]|uniref:sodium-dependent transporter n=1 Tax=Desulfuromonas sp. AOP6 TaxID=1566351 RepID=UPI00126D89FF|nr:sodium-dependent transporter [Desulfuromonas sp. AOP6]BCA79654.1 transporter [Desulfuromonas sp. AOP6]